MGYFSESGGMGEEDERWGGDYGLKTVSRPFGFRAYRSRSLVHNILP